jgi:predicted amidohydrolase
MRTATLALCSLAVPLFLGAASAPDGWEAKSPREEIRPRFTYDPAGGRNSKGALVIESDGREGLDGHWSKQFPVTGGKQYEFTVYRRITGGQSPQHHGLVNIRWFDAKGGQVLDDRPLVPDVLPGFKAWTPAEYPTDRETTGGWTKVSGAYPAPGGAAVAVVQLYSRWARNARVKWSDVELREAPASTGRKVRLATVHFRPSGKSMDANRRQYAPFIERAAEQKADLVVLGETLTYVGVGRGPAEVAEPVPGPTTEYFAELARKHGMYIVTTLYERAGHLVYNVAVLISPEGHIAGKYRKITLPDGEVERGVAPGTDYPVFTTRFGKLGMMICYDGFFPEVARELTKRGAEVIAWPVWGCNPDLAKARAAENHVYLVSSTYEDIKRNWMLSAVWDPSGRTVALAKDWGTVAIAEVDLDQPTRWPSLGDFKAKLPRHVPLAPAATRFE